MLSVVSAVLALASLSAAQTFTSCNPLQKTCPADPALGTTLSVDFTKGADTHFNALPGTTLKYGANGAEFIINTDSDAPTAESNWYIMFGKVEVVMRASAGVGIVSSVVLESDDLDEVDWEWLGGDTAQVQTNYFGKGDTTTYDRGGFSKVANPQSDFHTYTLDWTSQYIKWSIDGTVVRTLNYADAKGGARFPQTPCRVKLGSWVAGSPKQPVGTQQWAGGLTDFSQAPFTMYVKSLTVTDGTTGGGEYVYSDNSGSWQSIKVQGASNSNTGSSSSLVVVSSSVPTAAASSSASSSAAAVSTTSSSKAASTTSAAAASTSSAAASSSAAVSTTLVVVTTATSSAAPTTAVTSSAPVTTSASAVSATVTTTTAAPSSTRVSTALAAPTLAPARVAVAGLGLALGYLVI